MLRDMSKNHPPRQIARKTYSIKPEDVVEKSDPTAIDAAVEQATPNKTMAHPTLVTITRLLGRQAAAHFHRYRFQGLGRIELLRLQDEASVRSINSARTRNKSSHDLSLFLHSSFECR